MSRFTIDLDSGTAYMARAVIYIIGIGLAAALVTQEAASASRSRERLSQCLDLLELEHEAGAVCVDVLGECVDGIGDLADAKEIGEP